MSCALPCTWWCCTIEPVWAPPRKLQTKSLSYVCFGLFYKPIIWFWLVVVFELLQWQMCFHTFPKRYSHVNTNPSWSSSLPTQFLLNRRASLQVDPIIFNIHEINSQFFAMLFVSFVPSCLCFPAHPPFLFKDSDSLIKYPSYGCEICPFFSVNVLIRWFSRRY